VDNLSNSSPKSVESVERITQKEVAFHETDLRDLDALNDVFSRHQPDAVLHFAGLKAVGESVQKPLEYYDNNVNGTLCLLQAMSRAGVNTLVFSSSATVYGIPDEMPIDESFTTGPINPYGRTKLQIEDMLKDLADSDPKWRIALLRYFNPVGAHPSGELGEDPNDIPNNLVPYLSQVAIGKLKCLSVFADDYPTRDGTGVRDYIHVLDLVQGHLKALEFLRQNTGVRTYNLGTGHGYSVLEMIHAFEKASNRSIPYKIVARRPGDAAESYADPTKAEQELGWKAERELDEMCADVWRWQSKHPDGFV
jgi:UDP-glucose 4-epimerase